MKTDNNRFDPNYIPDNHENAKEVTISTINFDESINESQVGITNIRKIGECKIEVYANEGNIPHFHMYNSDRSFDSCICIYSPNYFSHGGKYRSTLSSSQCKLLDTILRSKNELNVSLWVQIVILWESMNSQCKFPENRKVKTQPDYTKMVNFKDA